MSGGVDIPGLSRRLRGAVYDHVYDNHTHEVGGVLVGDLGDGDMPVVTGCIAALEARGERASVTFTHDAWSSIHAQMESDFPGKQIVGWYHSHPGFGIFLSGHDIFIQENFFSDPRQIAYVVDPHAGTEGVFGWRAGKVQLIEEAPAGRQGTGGPRTPRAETTSSRRVGGYGGLVAVVAVFLGIGGGLLLSADSPPKLAPPTEFFHAYEYFAMRSGIPSGPIVEAAATVTPQPQPQPQPVPQPQPQPQAAPPPPPRAPSQGTPAGGNSVGPEVPNQPG